MAETRKKMAGRLQDVERLQLAPQQVLTALNSAEGLERVQKESGLSREEVGAEVQEFIKYLTSAWNMVQVDKGQNPRLGGISVACW